MRILLTKIPTLAFIFTLFVFSQHAHSHCQIPCGIYDDHARYISMLEDASTAEKATNQIITLSSLTINFIFLGNFGSFTTDSLLLITYWRPPCIGKK